MERPKGRSMKMGLRLRARDRLGLCYQYLVSIRVVEVEPLYAGARTVQVVLDLIRFGTPFIELFVGGGNVGS